MDIKTVKTLYKKLPREVFCKSLHKNIKITRAGYKHVFQEKTRKKEDIKTRAKAIELLKLLIESINLYQYHTKIFNTDGDIEYWNLQGVIQDTCIHITIRKIGGNPPHLYSWHYKGVSPKCTNTKKSPSNKQ
jgi:hypothetical protein